MKLKDCKNYSEILEQVDNEIFKKYDKEFYELISFHTQCYIHMCIHGKVSVEIMQQVMRI